MTAKNFSVLLMGLLLIAEQSLAGSPLSVVVGTGLGVSLPLGIGGIASIAAIGLILGVQVIKRNKNR
jgi:hypothetical protein